MFLLDTNVVSELRKARSGQANKKVVAWAKQLPATSLFVSAITILELELGVQLAERRDPRQGAVLRQWLDGNVLVAFTGRVLPIDTEVAVACARLHVPDPRSERDALIGATALVHGLTVATRNVSDFRAMNVAIHDPWM